MKSKILIFITVLLLAIGCSREDEVIIPEELAGTTWVNSDIIKVKFNKNSIDFEQNTRLFLDLKPEVSEDKGVYIFNTDKGTLKMQINNGYGYLFVSGFFKTQNYYIIPYK